MQGFLTIEEEKMLKDEHKKCKTIKQADRIKTLLYLNMGYSYTEAAKLLLLDESTIRKYYKIYQREGLYKLLSDDYQGGTSRLIKSEEDELIQHLEEHIYLSAKEIIHYVKVTYGVCYTVQGMTSMLHRLGFSDKKPKHIPGKANKEAQEEFIVKYRELKANKKAEDHIYFMDGVHPLHNSQAAYGWIKTGKEKTLKTNTGRQRVNINGAYDIEEQKVIIREDESINAQSTIALLEQMLKEQPFGMLYIILDNARYYKCILVTHLTQKTVILS